MDEEIYDDTYDYWDEDFSYDTFDPDADFNDEYDISYRFDI